jgi:hypothetical protein
MRSVVSVVVGMAFVLAAAGCGGGDQAGEKSTGQYGNEGTGENAAVPGPTNAVTSVSAFSEEDCLDEASGSGKLGVEVSDPGKVPSYEVVKETSEQSKELEVVTAATSGEDLRAVAEKLRYENRDTDAISIDFFNETNGERQDAGIALIFNTREAGCRSFRYPVEEQDEIASQDNGITVLSVAEGV